MAGTISVKDVLVSPLYQQGLQAFEAVTKVKGFLTDTALFSIGIIKDPKKLSEIENPSAELKAAFQNQAKSFATISTISDISKQIISAREYKLWHRTSEEKITDFKSAFEGLGELVHLKKKLFKQVKTTQEEQSVAAFFVLFASIATGLFVFERTQSHYLYRQPNVIPAVIFGSVTGAITGAITDRWVKRNDEKTMNLALKIFEESIRLYNKFFTEPKVDGNPPSQKDETQPSLPIEKELSKEKKVTSPVTVDQKDEPAQPNQEAPSTKFSLSFLKSSKVPSGSLSQSIEIDSLPPSGNLISAA